MRTSPLACPFISALLACGYQALAQTAQVSHTLRWLEVDALTNTPVASPNGVLEPGEGARIIMDTSFTPPAGSAHAYSYPEPGGVGILKGFGGSGFNLFGIGSTDGDWSHRSAHAMFNHLPGTPDPNGGLWHTSISQVGSAMINPLNPIVGAWMGVWTPSLYSDRNAGFTLQAPMHYPGDVVVVEYGTDPTTGNPLHTYIYVTQTFGASVQIPIVPAPGAAPILFGTALIAFRRRRSS